MKKQLIQFLGFLGLTAILFGCNSSPKNIDLMISDESGTVSISNYNVQFGNSTKELIKEGLKDIILELKEVIKKKNGLKGTVKYSFRCEPNGLIRWMAAGQSDLLVDNQDKLKNELTDHLMTKQIRFPELGEMTMVEVTIKFE